MIPLAALVFLAQIGQTPNDYARDAARIGATIGKREGAIVISAVEDGSSAQKSGLKIGDQLLRIDMDDATSMSQSAADAALRGMIGSHVRLTVLPRGGMVPRTVEVERDVRVYLPDAGPMTIGGDPSSAADAADIHRKPVITVVVDDVQVTSGPDAIELKPIFERGAPDVATCVGAAADFLPKDLATLSATMTFARAGTISVRTDPPSGDLSSCLGRKAAGWKTPKPDKKTPTIVKITWSISRK